MISPQANFTLREDGETFVGGAENWQPKHQKFLMEFACFSV